MNRSFKVVARLNYDMDIPERSDAELEAENRFIERLGDDLTVVERIEELE